MQRPVRRAPEPHGAIRVFFSISGTCRSVIAGLVWGALLASAAAAPDLGCGLPEAGGIHTSTDGVVDLKWSEENSATYQLEESIDGGDFKLRYEGPDLSSVRTGLAAGDHVFRVRAIDPSGAAGTWSEVLRLKVGYMDASRLRLLLLTGGIVVLATIAAIIHGHLTHRKEGSV